MIDVKKLLEPIHRATMAGYCNARAEKLLAIEDAITQTSPDAIESCQIIDALAAGLKIRFDDCTEAMLYLSLAKLSLERLDIGYQVEAKEELEALEDQIKRSQGKMP